MKTIERNSLRPKFDKSCVDSSLDKYKVNNPFPEKLAKANEIFKTAKLPKNRNQP